MMRELLALLVYASLLLLRLTWRVRVEGPIPRAGTAALIAFWHGDLIALLALPRRLLQGVNVMVSRSRDGDLATGVARRFSLLCIRGSSSSGAVPGALAIVRRLRHGGHAALAVDGPRGPRLRDRAGVTRLARMGRAGGVIPLAAQASSALTLGSWDALTIPTPFARVTIVWREPVQDQIAAQLLETRAAAYETLAR